MRLGSEQKLTDNYLSMLSTQSAESFQLFYNRYKSLFFEDCELQPGEMQGRTQIYRYNSGLNFVGSEPIYCNIIAGKNLMLNESVGSRKIPISSDFDHIEIVYKLPNEEEKTIYYKK